MKKMILTALMLALAATTTTAFARMYDETAEIAADQSRVAAKASEYVTNFCDMPGLSGSFESRVKGDMGRRLAERYPGSNIDCNSVSGIFVADGVEYDVRQGRTNRRIDKSIGNGLVHEMSYSAVGSVATVKISDFSGNYLVFRIDTTFPQSAQFIDARLPINMQSAGSFTGKKGVSYTNNELIDALNSVSKKMDAVGGRDITNLYAFSNTLLTNPQAREDLVRLAISATVTPTETKKSKNKKAGLEKAQKPVPVAVSTETRNPESVKTQEQISAAAADFKKLCKNSEGQNGLNPYGSNLGSCEPTYFKY